MKVCVMTAETNSGNGHPEFLGVVVGATLEECRKKAGRKWSWYGCKNEEHLYYSGCPIVTTRWMAIG